MRFGGGMATAGHPGQTPGSWSRAGRRGRLRWALRSALLAGTVFALAATIGILLSAAAPADLITEPTPAESAATDQASTDEDATAQDATAQGATATTDGPVDTTFARSLIISGAAALAVSIAGSGVVLRRRRQW